MPKNARKMPLIKLEQRLLFFEVEDNGTKVRKPQVTDTTQVVTIEESQIRHRIRHFRHCLIPWPENRTPWITDTNYAS